MPDCSESSTRIVAPVSRSTTGFGRLWAEGLGAFDTGKKLILVTAHRRESFGEGFDGICEALLRLGARGDVQIVYPTPKDFLAPQSYTIGSGPLHLAFSISAEDLPAWERLLVERGIAIETRIQWPRGGRSVYFRDPDNHSVELATPGLWSIY